jgi:hypothetical protein
MRNIFLPIGSILIICEQDNPCRKTALPKKRAEFSPGSVAAADLHAAGVSLLVLNFLDGLYKLSKLNWHAAYQIVMSFCYIALSVRLIQLILAFRGE